jgi:hypothetical protein
MRVLSSSKQQNITLNDSLANLLIEEWSPEINYTKYFAKCAPLFCRYTENDQTNFSYMITLLLSLYGGLILLLRLIACFSVNIVVKLKLRLINRNFDIGMYICVCLNKKIYFRFNVQRSYF